MLLICPSGFSLKGYDIINYDSNKSWVDIINDVGMEKSLRELKNKRLYEKVVMLNDTNINVEETNNLGRYTIYSYNCLVEKKNTPNNFTWVSDKLSLKKPSIWNWYSDSLTFDIISNITKKLWEKLEYNYKKDDVDKFLCYLSTMNIHIEKL
tara:strand:- start:1159 stop:1614 length:456 start_codon:yes stop_codon:yes gene_type:complete